MACSKIFSGDLPELINGIAQHLQDDFSTLHSFILVNKICCRLAIPLLWENPFSSRNCHFIKFYFDNLNEDDKTKLNECGISNDIFPSKTLFNYPHFIKYLSACKIIYSVQNWIADVKSPKKQSGMQHINPTRLVYRLLLKRFIENEVYIHTFEVEMITDKLLEYFNDTVELILQNPNFIGSNLKVLKLCFDEKTTDATNIDSLLFLLSSNCNSISNIYFQFKEHSSIEKFSSDIINSQNNLKKITFLSNEFPLYHSLLSLKNHCSNTLRLIAFCFVNFKNILILKEVFDQLNVLECIQVLICYSLNSDFVRQVVSITKPFKLRTLFMSDENFPIESFQLLLQKTGDYLENIKFGALTSSNEKRQLLEQVVKYCPKIKYFELWGFENQDIYLTFDLIKNVGQNLKYLISNIEFAEINSVVLKELGQVLPLKLEYLSLYLASNTSDFEIFLKNFQNTFIKKLVIENRMQESVQDIFPYIEEYIMKRKRVRYLAFKDGDRDLFFLNDKLKEFESYDIKIKNYDDLKLDLCGYLKNEY